MSDVLIGLLIGLGLLAVSFVGVWLLVYGVAVRNDGGRLLTRRRWQNFRTASVECHAGPFDGVRLPVARLSVAFIAPPPAWPNVLYDATTGAYRFGPRPEEPCDWMRDAWAGYYRMVPFTGERFEWYAIDTLKRHADELAAELRS